MSNRLCTAGGRGNHGKEAEVDKNDNLIVIVSKIITCIIQTTHTLLSPYTPINHQFQVFCVILMLSPCPVSLGSYSYTQKYYILGIMGNLKELVKMRPRTGFKCFKLISNIYMKRKKSKLYTARNYQQEHMYVIYTVVSLPHLCIDPVSVHTTFIRKYRFSST